MSAGNVRDDPVYITIRVYGWGCSLRYGLKRDKKSSGFASSGHACNHIRYNRLIQSGIILRFHVVAFISGTEKQFNGLIRNR